MATTFKTVARFSTPEKLFDFITSKYNVNYALYSDIFSFSTMWKWEQDSEIGYASQMIHTHIVDTLEEFKLIGILQEFNTGSTKGMCLKVWSKYDNVKICSGFSQENKTFFDSINRMVKFYFEKVQGEYYGESLSSHKNYFKSM